METQYYKHLNSTFTRVNQVISRITIKYENHAAKRHATDWQSRVCTKKETQTL